MIFIPTQVSFDTLPKSALVLKAFAPLAVRYFYKPSEAKLALCHDGLCHWLNVSGIKTGRENLKQNKTASPCQKQKRTPRKKASSTLERLMTKLDHLVSRLEADDPDQPVSEADVKLLGHLIKSFEQLSALRMRELNTIRDQEEERYGVDDLRSALASRLTKLSQRGRGSD